MSDMISEMGNSVAGISAYETPAKPMVNVKKGINRIKDRDKSPIDWNKMLKKQKERRGE
jgi:hypothetical protein